MPEQGRDSQRSGDNDSSVTAWAVQGLLAARRAGVKIPDESLKSAAKWFEDVTDGNYGRVYVVAMSALTLEIVHGLRKVE
jgi:hypothetical protein